MPTTKTLYEAACCEADKILKPNSKPLRFLYRGIVMEWRFRLPAGRANVCNVKFSTPPAACLAKYGALPDFPDFLRSSASSSTNAGPAASSSAAGSGGRPPPPPLSSEAAC